MKIATVILLTFAAAACNGERLDNPQIPEPRPPTLDELVGSRLSGQATYPVGTPDPWSVWTGGIDLELLAPVASEPAPVASASLNDGLDGTCLGSPEGFWEYDPASGALTVRLVQLTVQLTVEQYWTRADDDDDRTTAPVLVPHLRALGTWDVVVPADGDCEGDFAGGTAGVLVAQGVEVEALQVSRELEPGKHYRLAALALDARTGRVAPVYRRIR